MTMPRVQVVAVSIGRLRTVPEVVAQHYVLDAVAVEHAAKGGPQLIEVGAEVVAVTGALSDPPLPFQTCAATTIMVADAADAAASDDHLSPRS